MIYSDIHFYAVILRRTEEYARSMHKRKLMRRNTDTGHGVRSFGNAPAFIPPPRQEINGHVAFLQKLLCIAGAAARAL